MHLHIFICVSQSLKYVTKFLVSAAAGSPFSLPPSDSRSHWSTCSWFTDRRTVQYLLLQCLQQSPEPVFPETMLQQSLESVSPKTVLQQFPEPDYSKTVPQQLPECFFFPKTKLQQLLVPVFPKIVLQKFPKSVFPKTVPKLSSKSVSPKTELQQS